MTAYREVTLETEPGIKPTCLNLERNIINVLTINSSLEDWSIQCCMSCLGVGVAFVVFLFSCRDRSLLAATTKKTANFIALIPTVMCSALLFSNCTMKGVGSMCHGTVCMRCVLFMENWKDPVVPAFSTGGVLDSDGIQCCSEVFQKHFQGIHSSGGCCCFKTIRIPIKHPLLSLWLTVTAQRKVQIDLHNCLISFWLLRKIK